MEYIEPPIGTGLATWATSTPSQSFNLNVPFIPKFGWFSFLTTFKFKRHEHAQTPPQLPLSQEQIGSTPETVFLRQRFHQLRIEFRIENTARDIRDALLQKKEGPYVLKSSWNLFLRPGKGPASAS